MHCFFLSPTGFGVGLTSVSLGLIRALERNGLRAHFLKLVAQAHANDVGPERSTALVNQTIGLQAPEPWTQKHVERLLADGRENDLLEEVFSRFQQVAQDADVVVVEGMAPTRTVSYATRANQQVAQSLGADVILVTAPDGEGMDAMIQRIELHARGFSSNGQSQVLGVVVNRVDDWPLDGDAALNDTAIQHAIAEYSDRLKQQSRALSVPRFRVLGCVPWQRQLSAPRSIDVATQLQAEVLNAGDMKERRVLHLVLAARRVRNIPHLQIPGTLLVVPSDRDDIIIAASLASLSGTQLAGVLLTGGEMPHERVMSLCQPAFDAGLPVFKVSTDSYTTATHLDRMNREIPIDDTERAQWATDFVASHLDHERLKNQVGIPDVRHLSPPAFRYNLVQRARQANKCVVLPEGSEPRTVQAAIICHQRSIARCILLAKRDAVEAVVRANALTLPDDLQIIDPETVRERYVAPMVELRKGRGLPPPMALQQLEDNVVLGTMMLALGEVDGLVSGAIHTTANTIRPAFQLIKTAPQYSLVSSVFFMLLPDQVVVYGDCAVNPTPSASELAEIAIQSAASAKAFGIEPRVAMLSYSTGASGAGSDVELVIEATRLVRERAPDLLVDGPLQYDAAAISSVGKQKAPDSLVAGQATVFIFPDLNTGNTTYKAVQRSANVISVGPMLQGLNKPVNDLSRGALVDDIVFTIALTAIQAV
ncbi:Phosphate acetyltransferase [gamma proteobacterium HdN1]|nr:Phosphate acetyltransferase [gamma proteobacterium HdN1]